MEDESDPQSSGASPSGPFEPGDPNGPALIGRTYQSNTVNLSTDGEEICAMIGPDPVQGIAGYGASVHEALRDLADMHPVRVLSFQLSSLPLAPSIGTSERKLSGNLQYTRRCRVGHISEGGAVDVS